MSSFNAAARHLAPGVTMSAVVAVAATFLAEHYHAPVMLFALLLGMAVNFLSAEGKPKAGIEFTSREVLRVGVALLGIRITFGQIAALGWEPVALVIGSVVVTIVVSMLAARALGFPGIFGMLTGGATAICGASAALALAAALPGAPRKEQATLFTVIGVSALSTVAMIAYPAITRALDLDPGAASVFLGGTIHDVAQVVAAGYMISPEVGDGATFVKLLRVAMLLPVVLVFSLVFRTRGEGGNRPPLLPGFLIGFAILVVINSLGIIPKPVTDAASHLSRWCLVVAIAALGVKTSLQQLASLGWRPVLMLAVDTVFLAGLILGGLLIWR